MVTMKDKYEYEIIDNKVTIKSCHVNTKLLIVPSLLEGKSVDVIGERAVCNSCNHQVEVIKIPEGIKKIESNNFSYFANLVEVFFPSTLEIVGENMFENSRNIQKHNNDILDSIDNMLDNL